MSYAHDGSETTSDGFTFTVSDGAISTTSTTFDIIITGVNNPPELMIVNDYYMLDAGITARITGVYVTDVDAGATDLQVDLHVNNGSLSLVNGSGVTIIGSRSVDNLSFSGTLIQINNAFSTCVMYTPDLCENYSDALEITVTDTASATDTETINLDIQDIISPMIDLTVATPFQVEIDSDSMTVVVNISDLAILFDECGISESALIRGYDGCGYHAEDTTLVFSCDAVGKTFPVEITAADSNGNAATELVEISVTDPNGYCNYSCGAATVSGLAVPVPARGTILFTPPVVAELGNTVGNLIYDMNGLQRARLSTRDHAGQMVYLGGSSMMTPGVGYFIRSGLRTNETMSFSGCSLDGPIRRERVGRYAAFLTGNPYPVEIPITNFVIGHPSLSYFFLNTGGGWTNLTWDQNNMVPSGAGVWIFTLDPCLDIYETTPASPILADNHPSEGWLLQLQASADGMVDKDNYLGVRKGATAAYDPENDRADLLSMESDFLRVTFPHDWSGTDAALFSQDVREPFDGTETWSFEVEANLESDEIELSWPNISDLDKGLDLVLINEQTGDRIDMRETSSYLIDHAGKAAHSLIELDTYWSEMELPVIQASTPRTGEIYPFRIEITGNASASISGNDNWTYGLFESYPNPFNAHTTIRYQIPSEQNVTLQIYNASGQLVRTLVNESVSAGDHTATWDGTNENDSKVRSGIYFYRMTAGDFTNTKKMVLTK